ncbi:MAG: M20/M25/M40 family metallo-hydrolase [Clostridia bacterium]|nr:M20/M25/M40 family metallo-hydrolase [Clostridia bacterium]
MEEYKILKDLVKFNTIKDKENKEIIDYIEKYLKKLGFSTEYKEKYLIMKTGENQKIGFLGHTDTVEYIQGWETNPFEVTKIDNKLFGLGTSDMKRRNSSNVRSCFENRFFKIKVWS